MSSLLKEAIVDATALKEAALKNAEASIIDKYSVEVREALERLLEQDDLDLSMGGEIGAPEEAAMEPEMEDDALTGDAPVEEIVDPDDVPLAAIDGISDKSGTGLSGNLSDGEKVEFNLDLGSLQEAITDLQATLDESAELDFEMSDLEDLLAEGVDDPGSFAGEEAEDDDDNSGSALAGSAAAAEADKDQMDGIAEKKGPYSDGARSAAGVDDDGDGVPDGADADKDDPDVQEESFDFLVDEIVEKLTVDMGATLSGWAGRSSESQKWEMEKALAHRRSTDMQDELEVLRKAQEELVFENKQLREHLSQYKEATTQLKEGLQDVNLSNARLLYTNRVLRNTSLNERQKERIVEAISRAGSVTEARTIFDTLQSTVEAKPTKSPQSLSEAITRRSSVIRASRHNEKPSSDPLQDRMKRLAGIK